MTELFAPPIPTEKPLPMSPPTAPPLVVHSVVIPTVVPGRNRRWRASAVIVAVAALVTAGLYGLRSAQADTPTPPIATTPTSPRASTPASSTITPSKITPQVANSRPAQASQALDVAKVAATITPSVVKVSVEIDGPQGQGEGVGTGIIISATGDIVTNNHVVENATKVRVLLNGETEPQDASVVGTDPGNDLALIHIEATKLPVAEFAADDSVRMLSRLGTPSICRAMPQ
jgi:putative serine protease PepD